MRILILGAAGMLGHKIAQKLSQLNHTVWCVFRGSAAPLWRECVPEVPDERIIEGLDVTRPDATAEIIDRARVDAVINCVGLVKQRAAAAAAVPAITINALLPHQLAELCFVRETRLIHFSTDCVFAGTRGNYTESDLPDAMDMYGRSKALGEVPAPALTIRTSIIGRELEHHAGLLDWFLSRNPGRVSGFQNVWWSGVTTSHLADIVARLLEEHPRLAGLYQVSSGRISKYDLLTHIKAALGLDIVIDPAAEPFCDRSLDGHRFQRDAGYTFPGWPALMNELARDSTPYPQLIPS